MKRLKERIKERFSNASCIISLIMMFIGFVLIFLSSCSEDIKLILMLGGSGCIILLSVYGYYAMPNFVVDCKQKIKSIREERIKHKEEKEASAKEKAKERAKKIDDCYEFAAIANKYSSREV